MLPQSSLLICSRNRPKLLLDTVESVLRCGDVPTEMIIVDQSDDSHPELSGMTTERPCGIRYLHSKIVGASVSRNLGIASSRFEILIFLDDDMFVEPDWFRNMVQAVVKVGTCGVVSGQVLAGEAEVPGAKAPSITRDQQPVVYSGRIGIDVLSTGNMGAYRSVFEKVGLFDERLGPGTSFPSAEDNDLGFRLLEQGYSIYYVPEAAVYHRAWRSEHEYLVLRWRYGVGRGAYYAKHMSWRDAYMLLRMARDIKRNLLDLAGYFRRTRRLNSNYLILIFGLFYGALRWSISQMGKSSS
jgi:GT2 family glycosyltransferase